MTRIADAGLGEFLAFFDSLPCAAWLVDRSDWHSARCNQRAMAHVDGKRGCTVAELDALFQPIGEPATRVGQRLAAAFATNAESRGRVRVLHGASGEWSLIAWPLSDGGETRAVGLLALECDAAGQRAKATWQLRLGHDLRGPLSPIRMALQLLKRPQIDETMRYDALAMIDRQVDELLALVQVVSDLMRVEFDALPINARAGDLNLLVDIVSGRNALLTMMEARKQALHCLPHGSDLIAMHDPARLVQLLEFLVGKASTHAPAGSLITLSLRVAGAPDGVRAAEFTLSGMADSFAQDADVARISRLEGDGFGEASAAGELMSEIGRLSGLTFQGLEVGKPFTFIMALAESA